MTESKTPRQVSRQKVKRAADDLFKTFEAMIISGELKVGAPLPTEREIVQAYGVSRTVVREAVLALANKGLVEARPRFRPIVRRPSVDSALEALESLVRGLLSQPNGVKNLFDTRTLLETALARQAALEATSEDIAKLKAALEKNEAAIPRNERFYRTDMAFHAVLYEVPRNPILPALHRAYTTWLAPQWRRMPRVPDRNRANYEAHRSIFEAIVKRDPDAAEAAVRRHLAAAWSQVQMTFGDI